MLNIKRETLLQPLQLVMGVVDRRQTLPILSNVHISINQEKLSITGSDLEVELVGQTQLENAPKASHQITIPGKKLMDICKALPENAEIKLEHEKEQIILRSGRSRFALSTLPAEDFPTLEQKDDHLEFSIAQNQLRFLLARTAFSMAQQDVRYYLNGMLLEIKANQLRAVATDGHRLSLNTVTTKTSAEHRLQIIIPRKGVVELLRLLDESEADVKIKVSSNHIKVFGENFVFTSKLIEGRFPDYERAIPKTTPQLISIDREEFRKTLSRTAILANEKFRGIRLTIKDKTLNISANNPEHEAAEDQISIDYSGETIEIGLNVNYLLDILNITQSEKIKISLTDANSSMLILEAGLEEISNFIVMPMRL